MTKIINKNQILSILPEIDVVSEIAEGFIKYSDGKVTVPPVGELLFDDPPGDLHIKYGYITGDDYFVIKIASGFYENSETGFLTSNGLMLVMNAKNGFTEAILLDEGHLTNIRTAAAGACVAKIMAPSKTKTIGIFGTGVQAKLQLEMLLPILKPERVMVFDIYEENFASYLDYFRNYNLQITFEEAENIAKNCNYIVTTTPAQSPLIYSQVVMSGTHITAVGSDTPIKQELDPIILRNADIIVADSIEQCKLRGEIFHALKQGFIQESHLIELGNVLSGRHNGRTSDEQITVADLTGVAVQDIQIAKAILNHS